MDELEQLTEAEHSVMIGSTKVIVREVTMKNLQAFTAACSPFLAEFDEAGTLGKTDAPPDTFRLFKVISDHADAMVRATALVSNAPVPFLERLKPDEFFKVAALVIRVNGDFFVQRLAPQLIQFARAMGLVGSMLSNVSSAQGTDTQS